MRSLCVLLVVGAVSAWADVPIQQLGFANGDDWEPAVAADGAYVYVLWPHFATSAGQPDSSGATCISNARSYMFLQVSSNSGTSFGSIVLPRCPVSGQQIDAQIVIGPNHRVYASYMDGNKANSTIQVIYSDDHGTTWSVPVNAAANNGGDKDILLVDSSGGVYVAYEHLGTNVVAYSPNVATTAFVQHGITIPTQAKAGTALAESGGIDTHGNVYFTLGDVVNNGKGDTYLFIVSSANQFQTSTSTMVDRSFGEPQVTGAGWDYWGAAMQMAIIPRPGMGTDRIVVAYNAGTAAGGAERIYTKYSDTNGATWNVAYDPSNYPNGAGLSLAPVGAWHGFPSLAATSAGVKVLWQDNRVQFPCTSSSTPGACGLFNNYLRSSADGATNWSAESKMQLLTNHTYQVTTPAPGGFFHPYGDYTWMCTDGLGNFQAIWGEGTSYVGPGTIYFAHGF